MKAAAESFEADSSLLDGDDSVRGRFEFSSLFFV